MNMNLAVSDEKKVELKKHVNAIHCSNNLSLVQRKLFNALLFNAYPDLPHKPRFQIHTRDLCKLIGYNSNDYGKLKKALLDLITIAIEWNVIDCTTGHEKQWKASSILASAELSSGTCWYEYSHIMKELLFQPEIYGRINIDLVSKFKSSYGLALYENCIRYQGLPQTPWFPIEVFRKLMGVFGDKYIIFKDFKKRVLNIAVDEVNSIAHIFISPEIERQNQKVIKIRFKLSKNQSLDKGRVQNVSADEDLIVCLTNTFGFSQPLIDDILAKYDQKYIKEKIALVIQSESFLAGKIRALSAYLVEALKKDYKSGKSSKIIVDENRKQKSAVELAAKEKEKNREARYNNYLQKKLGSFLSSLSQDQYLNLIHEFDINMKGQVVIFQKWYREQGLEHPAIKAFFHNFIKETQKDRLGEVLSYEDFVSLIDESN
jgi:plasmid replication initiation protein